MIDGLTRRLIRNSGGGGGGGGADSIARRGKDKVPTFFADTTEWYWQKRGKRKSRN